MLKASTLRPGLLVSLKTSITGNVRYETRTIDAARIDTDGALRARWETARTVTDPEEHEASQKARNAARVAVSRVCSLSAFGLLCPEANADKLADAIAEARSIAEAFNEGAKMTRVNVNVICGKIETNDQEAMRSINGEVRELLETMQAGIAQMKPETIRDAANKARSLGQMLSPEAQVRLQFAIDAARGAARQIVAAGESAAIEIDQSAIRRIAESRTAFLDLDDAGEVAQSVAPGRAVDFEAGDATPGIVAAAPARMLDLFA